LTLNAVSTYTGLTAVNAGTLAYGINGATGAGAVTVNGGELAMSTFNGSVGAVTLTSGSITGTTGVLTSTSGFTVQSGSASAILAGSVPLTKTTSGTVTLTGANTYTGLTTVNGGQLVLSGAAMSAVLAHTGSTSAGANIEAGQLVFAYGAGTDPIAQIRTNLRTSYVAGPNKLISGPMYTSTGAAAGYGLGYVEGTGSMAGSVIVKVAEYGDLDLSNKVDINDLSLLLSNYNHTGTYTWTGGDLNYDGKVDISDLSLLLANYNRTIAAGFDVNVSGDSLDTQAVGALSGAGFHVVVPEPGTLALLAAGLFGLLAYAWRKRQ
jgi:autotransporter-associated beta strand protein